MYDYSKVPAYMHKGIKRYVEQRIKPGAFIMAVLENNFIEAVGFADDDNIKCLKQWAELLYNELPSACWGSPGKVKAWLKNK